MPKVWLFIMCESEIPKPISSLFVQQSCTQKQFAQLYQLRKALLVGINVWLVDSNMNQ